MSVVTQTPFNGCDAHIEMADSLGVLHDVSGMSNKVEISFTRDIGEYSVFGDIYKYRLDCKQDGSISVTVLATRDVNGAYHIIKDWWTTRGFRWFSADMPNNNVGSDRYSGYFMLSEWSVAADSGEPGPIMITATLLPNGPINISTVAT